jgi:hypothetical protein
VIVLLQFVLPFVVAAIGFVLVMVYRKIQHPAPLVWGRIIPRVGPIRAHEVMDYNEECEAAEAGGSRPGREVRRHQFKVNWGYLRSEITNTVLFQQALLFEKMKIDPSKPGLKYEPREVLILELLDMATELRWMQVRWQFALLLRFKLGLNINRETFLALLAEYKELEEQMIALATAEGEWLRGMLAERLGLVNWRVIEGGQSDPDPA